MRTREQEDAPSASNTLGRTQTASRSPGPHLPAPRPPNGNGSAGNARPFRLPVHRPPSGNDLGVPFVLRGPFLVRLLSLSLPLLLCRGRFFCSPSRTQQEAQAKRRCGVPGQGRRANSQSQTCALRGHAPRHRGLALSLRVQVRRVRQAGRTPQVEQERQCEASHETGRSAQPPHALPTERERQDGGDKAAPSEHAAQCNAAAAFLAFFVAGSWSTMP